MGGAVIKFKAGSVGTAGENASYITRTGAVSKEEKSEALHLHNAPSDVEAAETWEEQRTRLKAWAETRGAEERARHGNRKGKPRTHYRVMMSYEEHPLDEEEVSAEAALEDAQEWLEKEFPEARAAAVVHQDTEHTHVHVWMSPRKMDGSKIDISPQDFRDLTGRWDRIYERRMKWRGRLREKMEETRRFKRKYAQLREQGASAAELKEWAEANRPERATPPGPEVWRKREKRLAGQLAYEEAERRVERSKEQREGGNQDLISEARDKIKQSHELRQQRQRQRHEGGSDRAEREAERRGQATERGEREADRGGAGEPERGSEGPSIRGQESGRERGRDASEGRGGKRKYRGSSEPNPESRDSSGVRGDMDRHSDGGGGSLGAEGRGASEVGGGGGASSGDGPSGASGPEDRSRGAVKRRIRAVAREPVEERTDRQRMDVARVFDRLDRGDQQDLWRALSEDERRIIVRGGFASMRRRAGTQEAHRRLREEQKKAVRDIQWAGRAGREGIEGRKARIEEAAETMIGMSEEKRDQVRGALPEEDEGAFEEALEKAQEKARKRERGRDRGRRGGRGR